MINIIMADAIKCIEQEVERSPEDYSDLDSEIQELILRMESFRNFIDSPTLEQLEKLDGDAS